MDVNDLIALEIHMYVQYCTLASLHDEHEATYKRTAHVLFYHIQEMRSTGRININLPSLDNVTIVPILNM